MKLDAFNHFFPREYFDKMNALMPVGKDMNKRVRNIPSIVDLDARFRVMDKFGPDYAQILTIPSPPVESFGTAKKARDLARIGNDGLAELVAKHPDRFPAFVASLPMNDPQAAVAEAKRAIDELGAVGVQIFTNINGRPVYTKDTAPLFALMAKYDLPIWMHPCRGADVADYKGEKKSHYEIWWTFGWPYETSTAMAHMVFGGLFDKHPDIKIITHHMGAMIPYFEGRVGPGWDQLGTRTSDEDYSLILKKMKRKGMRPIDYFRKFYADTAVFGALEATKCGLKFFGVDKVVFASDSPFDPEKGSAFIRWTIEILDQMDLSPFERHAIYEGNIRRLCKMDDRK
ncbi:MAG: amidohydrolase [Rhodospirillales bacterium]|nr:amidohydrolase [Rhodospirillales bacterium]